VVLFFPPSCFMRLVCVVGFFLCFCFFLFSYIFFCENRLFERSEKVQVARCHQIRFFFYFPIVQREVKLRKEEEEEEGEKKKEMKNN
ncbi:hypothetical protein CDQ72_09395, partial [Campylobacter hyointestinalis subsp. hyointestinalis]|uniref:hypothetical protein n=1 Tax=Campylobacter hyointestinalis TaxID=198 RepID=UPI000D481FE9